MAAIDRHFFEYYAGSLSHYLLDEAVEVARLQVKLRCKYFDFFAIEALRNFQVETGQFFAKLALVVDI